MKEYCLVPRRVAEKIMNDGVGCPLSDNKVLVDQVGKGIITPAKMKGNGENINTNRGKDSESENIRTILKMIINKDKGVKKKKKKTKKKMKPYNNYIERAKVDRTVLLPRPVSFRQGNPPIEHIINVSFSRQKVKHALALFKFFENKNDIEWDEYGELKRPITGINLIALLRKLLVEKSPVAVDDVQSYKFFLNTAGIPFSLIKNSSVKKQMEMNMHGKGWVGYV